MTQQRTQIVHQPPEITNENAVQVFRNLKQFFPPEHYNHVLPINQLAAPNLKGMLVDAQTVEIQDFQTEVYEVGYAEDPAQKQYALAKPFIMRLCQAAGIKLDTKMEKFIPNQYVLFKASANMSRDGFEITPASAHKDYNIEVIEEEIRNTYARGLDKQTGNVYWVNRDGSRGKSRGHIDDLVRRDILQIKKHMVRLCESKAVLAVIRMLLGIKSAYKKAELVKPFVIIRLKPDPSYFTTMQNRLIESQGVNAVNVLTGNNKQIDRETGEIVENPSVEFVEPDIDYFDDEPMVDPDGGFYEEESPIEAEVYPPEPAPQQPVQQQQASTASQQQQQAQHAQQPPTDGVVCCTHQGCNKPLGEKVINYCKSSKLPPLCFSHQPKE